VPGRFFGRYGGKNFTSLGKGLFGKRGLARRVTESAKSMTVALAVL